ncbi:DUF1616 domain-containing protein [Candidatus Woesearchaeota archaeon]|nr:DUF1616 domain-containing protein [Candidatus Woesearchaeota archaeon]
MKLDNFKIKPILKYLIPCLIIFIALILVLDYYLKYSFFQSLRIIFGLIYVLFVPGFVFVRLFLSKENNLDWFEIFGLSIGLSIVFVILSMSVSNLILKIPITTLNSLLIILVTVLIFVLIKKYQKQISHFIGVFNESVVRFYYKEDKNKKI